MNKKNQTNGHARCGFLSWCNVAAAPLLAVLGMAMLVSCSETTGEEGEFSDWQSRNDTYFQRLYTAARQRISSGDASWKIYKNWSLDDAAATKAENHIVVQVLQAGTGSGSPLYTDSVKVHYRGRLMPSANYPQGYVFDQSYKDELNPATAKTTTLSVGGVVDGFSTALQQMRIGDRWLVYIPYALGYGATTSNSSIPAYSTLVFDIQLVAYYRAGTQTSSTRAGKGHWVYE